MVKLLDESNKRDISISQIVDSLSEIEKSISKLDSLKDDNSDKEEIKNLVIEQIRKLIKDVN